MSLAELPRVGLVRTSGFKDRDITWRHMANQVSCYEIGAKPGTAFDYNDWQMVGLKSLFDMEKWDA